MEENKDKFIDNTLQSISNLSIENTTTTTTDTETTAVDTTTATITSPVSKSIATPKKELKNLVLHKLIDINTAKCYYKYKGDKGDIELIENNGEPFFRMEKPDVKNEFIIETSATTLLKSFFKLDSKTPIKGNSYVYINDKKIDDYDFITTSGGSTPFKSTSSATTKKISKPTTTTTTTTTTPTSDSNDNITFSTPGIDSTPYRDNKSALIHIEEEVAEEEMNIIEEEFEFLKKDSTEIDNDKPLIIENAKIKPSGVGRFFHFGCERYLSFSTRQTYKDNDPIKAITSPISMVQQKLIDDGFVWEEQVLKYLEDKQQSGNGSYEIFKPLKDAADITSTETIRILKNETTHNSFYMIQSTLVPPVEFKRALPDSITFSISKPDYLLVSKDEKTGIRSIEIQDAKSTTVIAFHQKIQLAFYYLLLNDIIKEQGIKDLVVSNRAGIYLKGNYQIEYFQLTDSVRILSSFLFGNLIKKQSYLLDILSTPKEQSPWLLSERCDGCEFINYCTNQLETEKSLNSSVNIKSSSLLNLIKQQEDATGNNDEGKSLINDLEYLLNKVDKEAIKVVSQKVDYIKSLPMIKATLSNQVVPTGFFDIRLSSYEDIQVYLELVHNPMDQSIYQWGVLLLDSTTGGSSFAKGNEFIDLISGLSVIFKQYHKSKLSLQCYLFDSFQKSIFFKQCFRILKEIESGNNNNNNNKDNEKEEGEISTSELNKESILLVLRALLHSNEWINLNISHFPQCNVPSSWTLSERQDEYSFLIIQDLIKTSFAINVKPFYTFENIVEKLVLSNNNDNIVDLSKINSNQIFKSIVEQQDVYSIIETRLHYQVSMITLLKQQCFKTSQEIEIKKASPFLIRDSSKYNSNKHLAKLFYCYQNECISAYRKLKSIRSNPLEINLLDGSFTQLKFQSIEPVGKKYRATFTALVNIQNLPRFEYHLDKSFSSFCLVEQSNYQQLWKMNEILATSFTHPLIEQISNINSFYVNGRIKNSEFISLTLLFDVPSNTKFINIQQGHEFILFEKYDIGFFSMHRSLLKSYDEMFTNQQSVFLDILSNPSKWCSAISDNQQFKAITQQVVESFKDVNGKNANTKLVMTKSQETIFNSIVEKRLQLVRGPPGTGKTHFLALIVLIFMECFKRKELPFRIVITSFTHNAIDNLLSRISALKKEYSISVGQDINFPLFKKQSKPLSDELKDSDVKLFDAKKDLQRDHICVGATSWSLSTMDYNDFDLLIIDEASQLSSYIGAIPFNRLNKQTGRVIVCGDNKQLGPVLNDSYPNKSNLNCNPSKSGGNGGVKDDNPKLQKSIFSCIKSHLIANGIESPYLSLYENFRMNAELCKFSQTLYGELYQCFKTDQESITPLHFDKQDLDNQLIESIFNNDKSCHTILLEDSQFGDKQLEAQIVKQIYKFLRKEYMKRPSTNSVELEDSSDLMESNFWRKDSILGVITPLHIQRNTVIPLINRVQLNEFKTSTPIKPIVNTVEVTQGKEFENVILCYNGFDDLNRISEFSFDLNRLNVGFTRSKKRFILIVSSKLFFPDESIFDNKRMSLAYNHLIKFIEFSKIHKFNSKPITNNNNNIEVDNNLIGKFNESLNI